MFSGNELWAKKFNFKLIKKMLPSGKVIETFSALPASIYEAVAENAQSIPDQLAVEDDNGNRFTYRELKEVVDRLAYVLKHKYGVKKKDHVAFLMYSSTEFAAAFLAVVKLGAVAVMLPTKYRESEIHALADRAHLDYVICERDFAARILPYQEKGVQILVYHTEAGAFGFSHLLQEAYTEEETDGSVEDVSVMMFTSGTTSLSKGVLITNYAYMHAVSVYQKLFSVSKDDSTVIPVPIYMITGLSALFGMMLFAGGTVYLQRFFRAKDVLQCVQEKGVSFLHAAPTVYKLLLEQREAYPSLDTLRCLACGGGWTSRQMIEAIHAWLPNCEFRTVYGMTETTSPATILPNDAYSLRHGESNGLPIPGMEMKIVDLDGNELPNGQPGEILMRGTNLLCGYYGLESPFSEDGWFHTGDIGYFTEDGFCYVVDRIKDMINRGGEKVISSDVEKELLSLNGVEAAAVVGVPHELYGEVPAAVLVLSSGAVLDGETIRAQLKTRIAGYKIPEHYLIVPSIPLTPNGKYDKKRMKTMFSQNVTQ